ncbi:MAG: alanyl-tRNA editing protein [Clostridia bacterium]|nr:alanyl-tRNA editing protein [Clostridia bacterium]
MTEKLYNRDAYLCSFDARVLSVTAHERGFLVETDATAFFPEGGGQGADAGTLGTYRVLDVQEREGRIFHLLDGAPAVGACVHGEIDFSLRFERMQCHTGEHIVSGILHSLYGAENVGFHLGDIVTLDIDRVIDRAALDKVEDLANAAVFRNLPVKISYPLPAELSAMTYRAKLDLTENVRIVTIDGVDACACCAPHVAYTGEIGLIKILEFEKHRGGTRILMQAGVRALRDYREKYRNIAAIGAALSTKQHETAEAVSHLLEANAQLEYEFKCHRIRAAEARAEGLSECKGSRALFLDANASYDELRALCLAAKDRVGGVTAALSESGGAYRYVMTASAFPIEERLKEIHAALSGRGGGRGGIVQGTLAAKRDAIEAYFAAFA